LPFRYSSDVSEPTQAEFLFPLPPLSAVVSFAARLGDTVLQGVVMSSGEAQVIGWRRVSAKRPLDLRAHWVRSSVPSPEP
jgi:hypothetical protein